MRSRPPCCCAIFILLVVCNSVTGTEVGEDSPPFDIDGLLKGPERKDFKWQAWAADPYLTVQQRFLVAVRATINCGRLRSRELSRDMHFVLKIASSEGRWVSEYSYTRVRVPPGLDKAFQIEYVDGLYLRPGRYVIALIAYDGLLKKTNVWRSRLTVERLQKDPLPGLDKNLPDVEFIHEAPETYFNKGNFRYDPNWPLSSFWEWLPVKNKRCLCIDIIANTSVDSDRIPSVSGIPGASSHILRIASVLSHLKLNSGQVRVSILDALRMKTLLYRRDAAGFDWKGSSRLVERQNPDVIDVDFLDPKAKGADYLFNAIRKIGNDVSCAPKENSPIKILILISGDMALPWHTPDPEEIHQALMQEESAAHILFFIAGSDQNNYLKKMLTKMEPETQIFSTLDPRIFRETLASLISRLEAIH